MGDKLSGPLALFALTFCKIFKTSFSVTDIKPWSGLQLTGISIPGSVCRCRRVKNGMEVLVETVCLGFRRCLFNRI